MSSWELVWTGQPAKPCQAESWSELVNQLNHVELGATSSLSYQLFQNLLEPFFQQCKNTCQQGQWHSRILIWDPCSRKTQRNLEAVQVNLPPRLFLLVTMLCGSVGTRSLRRGPTSPTWSTRWETCWPKVIRRYRCFTTFQSVWISQCSP